jgi:hypothetical protein
MTEEAPKLIGFALLKKKYPKLLRKVAYKGHVAQVKKYQKKYLFNPETGIIANDIKRAKKKADHELVATLKVKLKNAVAKAKVKSPEKTAKTAKPKGKPDSKPTTKANPKSAKKK